MQIKNKWGLHARPAAKFIKLTSQFKSQVYLEKEGERANGKSILEILSLALECGSWVKVKVDGEDEEEAIRIIQDFLCKEGT